MLAEVVPVPGTEVHRPGILIDAAVGAAEDLEAEPGGIGIGADIRGTGLGVPCAEEVVLITADEGGVARTHERLGGGGPDFAVEGGPTALVVGGTWGHAGAGTDHVAMISRGD